MLRSYLVDEENHERIIQFAPGGWFISDLNSLGTNGISNIYVRDEFARCIQSLSFHAKFLH